MNSAVQVQCAIHVSYTDEKLRFSPFQYGMVHGLQKKNWLSCHTTNPDDRAQELRRESVFYRRVLELRPWGANMSKYTLYHYICYSTTILLLDIDENSDSGRILPSAESTYNSTY